jgi:FKBP-type peptidyl-prolyl cis-trans isomerase
MAGAAVALLSACAANGKSTARSTTPSEQPVPTPSAAASPARCEPLPAQGKKPELPCLPGGAVPTSLTVRDLVTGSGPAAKAGDQLTVDYRGALYPGPDFDNSYEGQPFPVQLGAQQVIAGWDEGLVGMKAGGKRLLVIPPDKGYGPQGRSPIPPNATLRFVVELRKIG